MEIKEVPTYAEVACVRAGLPLRYAERLRGESYKELFDDAMWLKSQYRPDAPPLGNPDPRPDPNYNPTDTQMKRYAEKLARALDEVKGAPGWTTVDI